MRFAVIVCNGGSEPPPYKLAFVSAIEVRFAVVAHNGQSRTPVPTNKMFVLAIEVRFAVIVCNGAPGTSPPTNKMFVSPLSSP